MSSSHLLYLSFFLFFVFLGPPPVLAISFSFDRKYAPTNRTKPLYLELKPYPDQVFGFSSQGNLDISLNFTITSTEDPCPARLALCQASNTFVRGPNYRRRQSRPSFTDVANDVAATACTPSTPSPSERTNSNSSISGIAWCVTQYVCKGLKSTSFSVQQHNLDPNNMYLLGTALCKTTSKSEATEIYLQGQAHFVNPDLIFPELGFEEVLFPIFAAIIIALLSVTFLSLLIALLVFFGRRVPFRHIVQYVLAAVIFKLVVAVITFVHFFAIAQNGVQQSWFMYARLLFAFCADTLFIVALISVTSGFGVMPNSWFVEERSPIFVVYVAVVLQLLIIIAVKVMFPIQFLGAITYTIAGAVIAVIGTFASNRNSQFLQRYGHLIEQSHIFLKSTPIPRLRKFYAVNTVILPVAYAINIVSVILFDYRLNRPDLFWGILETVDAVLLVWLSVFVFPRPKSPLYVDMSDVSNDRLHQAERWRARQQRLQAAREASSPMPYEGRPSAVVDEANGESSGALSEGEREPNPSIRLRAMRRNVTQRVQRIPRPRRDREVRDQTTSQVIPGSNSLELGTRDTGDVQNPQPPWIAWTSGMSLPRPSVYTWRGRLRPNEVTNPDGNVIPLIYTPIVLGSPEGSSDVVMLRVGVPVTGVNAAPRIFDEKGNEMSETATSGRSPVRPLRGNSGGDDWNADRGSLLSLSDRLGFSSLLLYRVNQRTAGQADEVKSLGARGQHVQGAMGSSGQPGGSREDAETGDVTRDLSGSTLIECSDGTVSILDTT